MQPRRGRPPLPEEERARSKQIRLDLELQEKLIEVCVVLGTNANDYLEPLIRPQIESDHKANLLAIREMRKANEALEKARERVRKLRDELPEMANELGGES